MFSYSSQRGGGANWKPHLKRKRRPVTDKKDERKPPWGDELGGVSVPDAMAHKSSVDDVVEGEERGRRGDEEDLHHDEEAESVR